MHSIIPYEKNNKKKRYETTIKTVKKLYYSLQNTPKIFLQ